MFIPSVAFVGSDNFGIMHLRLGCFEESSGRMQIHLICRI